MIQDLSAMVKEHLTMFYNSTGGYKPHRIIMYRDSEGQFPHVLQVLTHNTIQYTLTTERGTVQ